MLQQITNRIAEKKNKHAELEAEIKNFQQHIQNKIAELNAVKGAICELEFLLEASANPATSTE